MSAVTRYLLDTNILLRFLSGEPATQAAAARKLFSLAHAGSVILEVSPVIVAETFYTLVSFYGVTRKEAAGKLTMLLQQRGIKLREAAQVLEGLERLQMANVSFADAYLAACGVQERITIASFDADFDKFKDIKRFEPKP